ncbi:MAG: hypothetical protein EOO38_23075 [Cytophagaceae bacterium]|nr:MAG: hypothetical protein EOO38_23075 [Cytophagaceae bacterium]
MSAYEVRIASDVDRDDLFVEVCFGNRIIAEALKKNGQIIIEWFPVKDSQFHVYRDLIDALKIVEKEVAKL